MLPSRPIRAVAFDLDGLIFNTEEVFHRAAKELIESRGRIMPPDLCRRMMGKRQAEAFQVFSEMVDIDEPLEDLIEESEALFFRFLDVHLDLMPGVRELLDQLDELQIPRAVTTSSMRDYADDLLERFDLMGRFDLRLAAEDVTLGKPHPEIYLTAASRLNAYPDELLVLEDSETGSQAGAAAGAFVVSVPHEHSREHDFSVANLVANTLRDPALYRALAHRPESD